MSPEQLIADYLAGPRLLAQAVAGMDQRQLDARPVPGKWSTRQVVCHVADFEPVYADRMKRVIVEQRPTLFSADPDLFAAGLAYAHRDVDNELALVEAVRRQMGTILDTLREHDFERIGVHSADGPLTLADLLAAVTRHIPHHVAFIEQKRAALQSRG